MTADLAEILNPHVRTVELVEGLVIGTHQIGSQNTLELYAELDPDEGGDAIEMELVNARQELLAAQMARALTPDVIEAFASRYEGLGAEHLRKASELATARAEEATGDA